jgi:hypothetical protein
MQPLLAVCAGLPVHRRVHPVTHSRPATSLESATRSTGALHPLADSRTTASHLWSPPPPCPLVFLRFIPRGPHVRRRARLSQRSATDRPGPVNGSNSIRILSAGGAVADADGPGLIDRGRPAARGGRVAETSVERRAACGVVQPGSCTVYLGSHRTPGPDYTYSCYKTKWTKFGPRPPVYFRPRARRGLTMHRLTLLETGALVQKKKTQ